MSVDKVEICATLKSNETIIPIYELSRDTEDAALGCVSMSGVQQYRLLELGHTRGALTSNGVLRI